MCTRSYIISVYVHVSCDLTSNPCIRPTCIIIVLRPVLSDLQSFISGRPSDQSFFALLYLPGIDQYTTV